MPNGASLSLMLAVAVAVAGAAQTANGWYAEAVRTYTDPSGAKLTQEGACSYDEHVISCWDSDGKPAPNLTAQIVRFFTENQHVGLRYAFRQKNRLILFSRSNGLGGMETSEPGGPTTPFIQLTRQASGPTLGFTFASAPPSAAETDFVASLVGMPDGPPVTIPYFVGSRGTYGNSAVEVGDGEIGGPPGGGMNYVIGTFGHGLAPSQPPVPRAKTWSYFVQIDPMPRTPYALSFSAINKKGAPIAYVDSNGRPTTHEPRRTRQQRPNDAVEAGQSFDSYLRFAAARGSVAVLASNIEPSALGAIQISGTHEVRVLFKHIMLDRK